LRGGDHALAANYGDASGLAGFIDVHAKCASLLTVKSQVRARPLRHHQMRLAQFTYAKMNCREGDLVTKWTRRTWLLL